MRSAAVTDNGEITLVIPSEATEVDITDVVLSRGMGVMPGVAYDSATDRLWVHSKLYRKYTHVTPEGRIFIRVGWFESRQYEMQQADYPGYVRYVKRNAKNHQERDGELLPRIKIIKLAGLMEANE